MYTTEKSRLLKLVRIRFTSWREQSSARRSLALQKKLEALANREVELRAAAASITTDRAQAESVMRQNLLTRSAADLKTIETERAFLVSAEEAVAEVETQKATEHEKAGTFGYQIFNRAGTSIAMIVDEAGNHLPAKAVYTYEVVDENPPRPAWAKDGKFRH